MYVLINSNMHMCYLSNPNYGQVCLTKDAMYLYKSVVRGRYIYKRIMIPYCLWGPTTFVHAKTEAMTILLHAFQLSLSAVGVPHLFLGQLAIQGSLESTGCFCLCHLYNLRTQLNKFDTCNKHMC